MGKFAESLNLGKRVRPPAKISMFCGLILKLSTLFEKIVYASRSKLSKNPQIASKFR